MSFALFGPAGNSESFYAAGHKHTTEAPAWLSEIGLDAYEYQCGNGIGAGEKTLLEIGESAKKNGIKMSLHTPYYISLSGVEIEKRLKSIDYIEQSLAAASCLGADIIVIHTGSAAKISRDEAMSLASDTLYKTIEKFGEEGIKLGLETMGKINQLGTLDEVLTLCKLSKRLVPVVDFGHLNAREQGGVFTSEDDYRRVFDVIGTAISGEVAKNLHCHFSKIEYTTSGEKRHLTFEDTVFGPDPEPLMAAIAKDKLTPRIICESAGTMADDALYMKKEYIQRRK